jgi:hypothetical protein
MFRNVVTASASQDDLSLTWPAWTLRLDKSARFNSRTSITYGLRRHTGLENSGYLLRSDRLISWFADVSSVGSSLAATKKLLSRIPLVIPIEVLRETDEMSALTESLKAPQHKTTVAVQQQLSAMASNLFEIGLYNPNAATPTESVMIPRIWDSKSVLKSIAWLRHQNRDGRNIYIRPKGEHDLSLIDDLNKDAVSAMKDAHFNPALVVETSPGNYQAWLKHAQPLSKEVSTAAARALAAKFGGDCGAADWRHFGRLAGFTNRKAKHFDPRAGLYPFVRLIEAGGAVYPEAERFLDHIRREVKRQSADRERIRREIARIAPVLPKDLKTVDSFRSDSRYGADGTRIDLAYAVYAFSHGASTAEVQAAIRSRDLSHKGNERRQNEYIERTIKKALATIERGR